MSLLETPILSCCLNLGHFYQVELYAQIGFPKSQHLVWQRIEGHLTSCSGISWGFAAVRSSPREGLEKGALIGGLIFLNQRVTH